MDWYPMMNSLRIAAAATAAVILLGIPAAYFVGRAPLPARMALDVLLALPLVLPPTVLGWLLLTQIGEQGLLGILARAVTGSPLVLTWQAAALASTLSAFPFLYLCARRAFDGFDENLDAAARTLGRSNVWVFWVVRLGSCWRGLLAGAVLAFARAMGEFGATYMAAGYTPGRTAVLSTSVFQLWSDHHDGRAAGWVLASLLLSAAFLTVLVVLEHGQGKKGGAGGWN